MRRRYRKLIRRRNPSPATGEDFNRTHLEIAEKMLCIVDKNCPEGSDYHNYRETYSGKPPWDKYSDLDLYVWNEPLKFSGGMAYNWLLANPNEKKRAVGIGTLWQRSDGDGYDTGTVVIRKDYRKRGLYTGVVGALREIIGTPIWSDQSRTAGAENVWKKYKKSGRAEYYRDQNRYRLANPRKRGRK